MRRWIAAGFTVLRREHHYLVPTDPDQTRLAAGALPAGMSLVSADAVDEDGLRLLARVWNHPRQPRLGLVGVTSGYRRRGLAKILLAAVFAPLCDRGISDVAAEADAAANASNALLSRIGARRVSGSVELVRREGFPAP